VKKCSGRFKSRWERSASVSRPAGGSCSAAPPGIGAVDPQLAMIPFGTVVGVYGVWVLFSKETEGLFNGPAVAVQS